jgi:peptidyl-prolyl cis-trans isomerase C
MLKHSRLALFAALLAISTSPVYAEDAPATPDTSATPATTISIPQARVEMTVKLATKQGQPDTPELRKSIHDRLVDLEILAQEAAKKGLDKQDENQQQIEIARQNVLAGAFVQDYLQNNPIGEDALKQEYDKLKSDLGSKEYNVRHILVEKESEAKTIAAKLKKGGKFDKLAKSDSKDSGSKKTGGDLGWIPVGSIPTTFVKPFADAVMNLSKGQVSEPVQSQFGWHIIKLEDVRDVKAPAFDDVKMQLSQRMQQEAVKKLIADLRDKAKIE